MIRRDELEPGIQFRIQDGASWTLQHIQNLIKEKAASYGISVSFRQDFISDNMLTNLLGVFKQECTVLYRTENGPKSTGFVMLLQTEGTYLFITLKKYVLCYTSWGIIVEDVFKELFT